MTKIRQFTDAEVHRIWRAVRNVEKWFARLERRAGQILSDNTGGSTSGACCNIAEGTITSIDEDAGTFSVNSFSLICPASISYSPYSGGSGSGSGSGSDTVEDIDNILDLPTEVGNRAILFGNANGWTGIPAPSFAVWDPCSVDY